MLDIYNNKVRIIDLFRILCFLPKEWEFFCNDFQKCIFILLFICSVLMNILILQSFGDNQKQYTDVPDIILLIVNAYLMIGHLLFIVVVKHHVISSFVIQ